MTIVVSEIDSELEKEPVDDLVPVLIHTHFSSVIRIFSSIKLLLFAIAMALASSSDTISDTTNDKTSFEKYTYTARVRNTGNTFS